MPRCDIAIIGAGPYGLSLSAHLTALGVEHRIFGQPLESWRHHMPEDMKLKSDGFASNLSTPQKGATLKDFCAERGLAYHDTLEPVPLDTFLAYGDWWQKRFVPHLEEKMVVRVEQCAEGFALELDDGERLTAARVVNAVGITWFADMPAELAALGEDFASHSFDHRNVDRFKGKQVVVLGAGASAVNAAALLADRGADVQIMARAARIDYHTAPDPVEAGVLQQIMNPPSGIGPGWRSFLCVHAPLLFHRMPERLRLRAVKNHLGPAAGWYMRARAEGRIPFLAEHDLVSATVEGGKVALRVRHGGAERTITCDHIIAATGFRPEVRRLPFLADALKAGIAQLEHTAILNDQFESSVPGLYFVGPAAANSFGPLLRFMVGAEFAAPRLAGHLARKAKAMRKAA